MKILIAAAALAVMLLHAERPAEAAARFAVTDTVGKIVNEPAFKGFGRFILPLSRGYDADMQLSEVSSLLPYHSGVDAQEAARVINMMADKAGSGELSFHPFYTEREKAAAPQKSETGLFFFKGKPGAPFAVVCPGGGFSYVGSIHEGFPYALELSRRGYNAFVIQYRTGGAQQACEDLAAAVSYIFANAEKLGVGTKSYSLWGGSAGARMAAYLGTRGAEAFGGARLPRPSCVVMQYTGHSEYGPKEPATFAAVGENDGIASPRVMERRIKAIAAAGSPAEFHLYPGLGHGFGLGKGTSAEGWLARAAAFWEKEIKKEASAGKDK